jgi:hypothetical protein
VGLTSATLLLWMPQASAGEPLLSDLNSTAVLAKLFLNTTIALLAHPLLSSLLFSSTTLSQSCLAYAFSTWLSHSLRFFPRFNRLRPRYIPNIITSLQKLTQEQVPFQQKLTVRTWQYIEDMGFLGLMDCSSGRASHSWSSYVVSRVPIALRI